MSKAALIASVSVLAAGGVVLGVMALGGSGDANAALIEAAGTTAERPQTPPADAAPFIEPDVAPRASMRDRQPAERDWEAQRRQFDEMRARFDLDGDGELNDEERSAMRQAMMEQYIQEHDKDGDGVLSDEEESAARWARMMNSPWGQRILRDYDTDGDGVLSEAERAKFDADREAERQERLEAHIERFDTDGDGMLSELEQEIANETRRAEAAERRAEMRARWEEMRNRFDSNGDGNLSPDERLAAREKWGQAMFVRQFDRDGNGAVDGSDLVDFLDLVRENDPDADMNRDGVVNDVDIQLFNERIANGENTMPDELADLPDDLPGPGGRGGRGGRGGPGGPRGG